MAYPSLPFFLSPWACLTLFLSGKKLSEKFAERQKKNDLIVLAPVIYESLLRNPALWQYDDDDNDDDNFTTAIQSIGVDWPMI